MYRMDEEQELLERAGGGDQEAFDELVAPYRDGLLWELRTRAGGEANCNALLEEALQQARARLMRSGCRGSFEAWVRTIARRVGQAAALEREQSDS